MFLKKIMLNYFYNPPIEEKWKKWMQWQTNNFDQINNCPTIDYYNENYFQINDCKDSIFYKNFGRFSYFLENKESSILDLIHLYDSCKGYARYFTGDPTYIKLIKQYSITNNDKLLNEINFDEFFYDYKKIHAHIVSLFSLSTLVMRMISYHLAKKGKMIQYGVKCLIEVTDDFRSVRITQSIEIFHRCSNCQRISEKIWGSYDLCYDCYLTKICNKCGKKKEIYYPSNYNLPICDKCN